MERTSKLKQIAIVFIFLSLSVFSGYAQQSATEGKDFYVTFPSNENPGSPSLYIRYVVTKASRITAEYGRGGYLDNNVLLQPGVYTRPIPSADYDKCYSPNVNSNDNRYIKIRSDENISVYALCMKENSTDATTVIPISGYGNHYTILGAEQKGTSDYPYIIIIAPSGGTVTIRTPNPTAPPVVQSLSAGSPVFTFMGPLKADLSGYTVESTTNIAVFSAEQRAGHPYSTGNLFWEQMWPTNTAGRSYLLWNLGSSDYIQLVGLEDDTEVTETIANKSNTLKLKKNQKTSLSTNQSRVPSDPVKLTSDKSFIVEHVLGGSAPVLKWWNPIGQRITKAIISPFTPRGNSVIGVHYLHIIIPASGKNYMTIRETRNGIAGPPKRPPVFSSNNTDPNYVTTRIEYDKDDEVLIELENPAGFLAYMTGESTAVGTSESYIITAGAGAFDLSSYFTVQTKTIPYMDTHYTGTDPATHSFAPGDSLLLKREVGNPIEVNHRPAPITWWLNGDTQPVTLPSSYPESINLQHTVKIPSSSLQPGLNEVHMHVRYAGESADSIYTGKVWRALPSSIPVNPHIKGFLK